MDILYLFNRRITFLRTFYDRASHPFSETQRQIENQEPPFATPPFDESGEPAYLEEWQDAEEGLEMLGQMCLTFLSTSLRLYLHETRQKLHDILQDSLDPLPNAPKRGFLKYEHWFRHSGISFEYAPVELKLIREIVETRNLIQHPESIVFMHAHPNAASQERFPRPFFAHPIEKAIAEREPDYDPTVLWITRAALLHSVDAVEAFCNWLEIEIWATKPVGVVTRYFPKLRVAAVELSAEVSLGQFLRFRKNDINFEQEIVSMQLHGESLETAPPGAEVGIQVNEPVSTGTRVYQHTTRSILATHR